MSDRVLVPLDGNVKAEEALEYAIENHPASDITVLYVLEFRAVSSIPGIAAPADQVAKETLENHAKEVFEDAETMADTLGHEGSLETITEEGDPEQVILDRAEAFDRIVLGTHGRDRRRENLLGGVAETVVRRSPIPVVVVK